MDRYEGDPAFAIDQRTHNRDKHFVEIVLAEIPANTHGRRDFNYSAVVADLIKRQDELARDKRQREQQNPISRESGEGKGASSSRQRTSQGSGSWSSGWGWNAAGWNAAGWTAASWSAWGADAASVGPAPPQGSSQFFVGVAIIIAFLAGGLAYRLLKKRCRKARVVSFTVPARPHKPKVRTAANGHPPAAQEMLLKSYQTLSKSY